MAECKDHLGNLFNTHKEMCKHYGISQSTFYMRLNTYKWSLKKTLTYDNRRRIKDHLGNEFKNLAELCKYHNVNYYFIYHRLYNDFSIREALTEPKGAFKGISYGNTCKDHLGNKFSSYRELCKYHKINYQNFLNRMKMNWDIEKAIKTPTRHKRK